MIVADAVLGDQLNQPMFERTWVQAEEEAKEHRVFPYEHLRRLLTRTSGADDPLAISPLRRNFRCLAGLSSLKIALSCRDEVRDRVVS